MPTYSQESRLLIFDCDPGCDDALAIALVVRHQTGPHRARYSSVDILTVAGNVGVDQTTSNAARVLLACIGPNAGFGEDCTGFRIFRGCSKALDGRKPSAGGVHGEDGLGDTPNRLIFGRNATARATLKAIKDLLSCVHQRGSAVERLLSLASDTQSFDLLCTGPLTNLGSALLQMDPQQQIRFWSLCDRAIIMGGAFNVRGNITQFAEFNIFSDPTAARIVLDSFNAFLMNAGTDQKAKRLCFIPLDVTETVAVQLGGNHPHARPSPAAPFLNYALKKYGAFHRQHYTPPAALVREKVIEEPDSIDRARSCHKCGPAGPKSFCHLHDPLAAWILLNGWCNKKIWSRARIYIANSQHERGQILLYPTTARNTSGPRLKKWAMVPVKWLAPSRFELPHRLKFISDIADSLDLEKKWQSK